MSKILLVRSEKDISWYLRKFRQAIQAVCSMQQYYSIFNMMYSLYSILQTEVKRCLSWQSWMLSSGAETSGKIWTSNCYMLKPSSSWAKAGIVHLSSCAFYRPLWYVFIVMATGSYFQKTVMWTTMSRQLRLAPI